MFVLQGIEGKKLMGCFGRRDRDREAQKKASFVDRALRKNAGLSGYQSLFYGIIGYFGIVLHSHLFKRPYTIGADGLDIE